MNDILFPYQYLDGYIGLQVKINGELPESLEVYGNKLILKSKFHINLINARATATFIDPNNSETVEADIVSEFKGFITEYSLEHYRIIKQFRFVQRDVRRTIIIMAEVPNLDKFFEKLREKFHKDIPLQPAHLTLYVNRPERGIGLLSDDELTRDTEPIEIPELENIEFYKQSN
jgi:hypothetical protein